MLEVVMMAVVIAIESANDAVVVAVVLTLMAIPGVVAKD